MKTEYVHWKRYVSASVSPPAVPMSVLQLWVEHDGTISESTTPVIGLLVRVYDEYVRPKRGEHGSGSPYAVPTPRTLQAEGYTFADHRVDVGYLYHDPDLGAITTDDPLVSNANVKFLVYPAAAGGPDAHERASAVKCLRAYHERHMRKRNGAAGADDTGVSQFGKGAD